MRIPYAFSLTAVGTLEINGEEANVVHLIFDYYLAGASLGKAVDMLYTKTDPFTYWKSKMDPRCS